MKPQEVRLLDVFVFGPFMVYAGLAAKGLPGPARVGLVALGVGTSAYNGLNYLRARELKARLPA